MRKLLWKKAAITAMAGTMMMMTGCELQGAVNKNQTTSTAATVQTSKTAESSVNTQPSSVTPNTTVQVSTPEQQNQAVTESASPESTAQSQAPASSSAAGSVTPSSEEQEVREEEVSFSFEWITGDVPEGDGDVAWFTVDPITEDNFWVKFHGSANEEGISNVRIAVWTEANGEDDIEYIDAESLGNETKAYPVYIQNHNNEREGYVLKVSYTNKAGEEKTCENYTRISLE